MSDKFDRIFQKMEISDAEKVKYCQFRGGCDTHCIATTNTSCNGCKFFAPTTPLKIKIVVDYFEVMEKLNDRLMKENEILLERNHDLQSQVDTLTMKINKLDKRVTVLKYLNPDQFGRFFKLSMLKKNQIKQGKSYRFSKKLRDEWDEIRLLINPNARR